MNYRAMYIELEDINAILSSWPVLERLYATCQKDMPIKLKFHEENFLQELNSFGEVKLICLDPKNIQAPIEMKHISWFQINEYIEFVEEMERKLELSTKLREMRNLEIISIDVDYSPWDFDQFNMDWFSSLELKKVTWIELCIHNSLHELCGYGDPQERDLLYLEMRRQKKKSKTISISHLCGECNSSGKFENVLKNIPEFQLIMKKSAFSIDMHQFLGILDSMSKIKSLKIDGDESIQGEEGFYFLSVWHDIGNRLTEKDTEKVFQNAMEIIGKFPRDETKFEIREMEYGFAIKRTKGNPPELTRIFEDGNGRVI